MLPMLAMLLANAQSAKQQQQQQNQKISKAIIMPGISSFLVQVPVLHPPLLTLPASVSLSLSLLGRVVSGRC